MYDTFLGDGRAGVRLRELVDTETGRILGSSPITRRVVCCGLKDFSRLLALRVIVASFGHLFAIIPLIPARTVLDGATETRKGLLRVTERCVASNILTPIFNLDRALLHIVVFTFKRGFS